MVRARAFVGLDVHKSTIAVAIADTRRTDEVRFWGNIANSPTQIRDLVRNLAEHYDDVEFTYEAGPCGYDIYRQLSAKGFVCHIVAPSRIPRRPGDRVKNDHRDAMTLARLARAGELSDVWVPDPTHEAMRDLVRGRHAANKDLKIARQRIQSFLLKYACVYEQKPWTQRHRTWLADRQFNHPAQQIVFQSYLNAMEQASSRLHEVEDQIREILPSWSLCPLVNVLQSLRGVALIIAVTIVAEVGDMTRFDNPKHLMAFLGLAPGEHSSGRKIRARGITKMGNGTVRRLLYEAAWNYHQTPKIGAYMLRHMPAGIPQEINDIAWKAQLRLHGRLRRLLARGKKPQVAVTAVARELVGFIWSIAHTMQDQQNPNRGNTAA